MRTVVHDKYFLRDLHREIDLYDRKLVHMEKHEGFASDDERETTLKKLTHKRDQLALTARSLAASGIQYDEGDLPRSFRPAGWEAPEIATGRPTLAVVSPVVQLATTSGDLHDDAGRQQQQALSEQESPLASALGNWQNDLAAYKKRRQKSFAA